MFYRLTTPEFHLILSTYPYNATYDRWFAFCVEMLLINYLAYIQISLACISMTISLTLFSYNNNFTIPVYVSSL